MKNLKLTIVAMSFLACWGSVAQAQGFVKVLTDGGKSLEATTPEVRPAKRRVTPEENLKILESQSQSSTEVTISTQDTPLSEKKELQEPSAAITPTVEPIRKSVPLSGSVESNSDKTEQPGDLEKSASQVIEPVKKTVPLNNPDIELFNRLRKFFIVSDYMIETPYEYGGYLLFRQGIEDRICDIRKPNAFYMLDHEGGRVNRIKSGLIAADKLTPENEDEYYHQWNKDLTTIKQKCVNVVLGPTVDINYGDRSYSKDLKKNLQITLPIVSAIERKGMVPVIKHFPGEMLECVEKYARREVRSCPQSFDDIHEQWQHFKGENFPAIMMSNYIYEKASPLPAVMDEKMYQYLRGTLKYRGLIVTDALWEMSVPITPKTVWEIFKFVDLTLLINAEQVEKMLPYIAQKIKEMPNGTGIQLLEDKEARIQKVKALID